MDLRSEYWFVLLCGVMAAVLLLLLQSCGQYGELYFPKTTEPTIKEQSLDDKQECLDGRISDSAHTSSPCQKPKDTTK